MKASQVVEVAKRQPATAEQIGRCHKSYDRQTCTNYYLVLSQTDNTTQYAVKYSRKISFTCTCKAGQHGVLCWHIRASIACAEEEKAAMAEQARLQAQEAARDIEKKWNIPAWMMRNPGVKLVGEHSR